MHTIIKILIGIGVAILIIAAIVGSIVGTQLSKPITITGISFNLFVESDKSLDEKKYTEIDGYGFISVVSGMMTF